MDIFENLIGELKEENLLEETVITTGAKDNKPVVSPVNLKDNNFVLTDQVDEDELIVTDGVQLLEKTSRLSADESETIAPEDLEGNSANQIEVETNQTEVETNETKVETNQFEIETNQAPTIVSQESGAEFFRKRATDEVAFLQMVEHVFAGLERDQMKIVPKPFDALAVKKVLHTFLQISKQPDADSSEQTQAEFQLLQETENWYSALTHRDRRISINHLRRYCETARPPLSSPALLALTRFYRNSPYSEQARGKFDFIVTRLFARDVENERREMVFSRDELIVHLKELYAEWSSIPLYAIDEDNSEIVLIALKFEDFMTEAAVAGSFDELIKNDFFNRLRLFKKTTNENFFSPLVVVASVESNIKIGNRYIELLEKEKPNKAVFEDKYGFLHDQTISDATGKTFQLVELLSQKTVKPKPVEQPETGRAIKAEKAEKPEKAPRKIREPTKIKESEKAGESKKPGKPIKVGEKRISEIIADAPEQKKERKDIFGVNRWLLIAAILAVVGFFGFYILSNLFGTDAKENAGSNTLNSVGSFFKGNIRSERVNGGIFSAVVLPSWKDLDAAKKQELLKKILARGDEQGFSRVQLLDDAGKTVGFASADKLEVYNP